MTSQKVPTSKPVAWVGAVALLLFFAGLLTRRHLSEQASGWWFTAALLVGIVWFGLRIREGYRHEK